MMDAPVPVPQTRRRGAVGYPLAVFLIVRLAVGAWAALALAINPLPGVPDEAVRPYLGAPILDSGLAGLLLGPWQRFDGNRYVRIAVEGYTAVEDSVFPPLFPWLMRACAHLLPGVEPHAAALAAGLAIGSLACLAAFLLFYNLALAEIGQAAARRSLLYLALFPTSFYLFAPYSESLFLLLVLAMFTALRAGRSWWAALIALLATLTRTTGVALILPLAVVLWPEADGGRKPWRLAPALLPALALFAFLAYRAALGLPSIGDVYAAFWYQSTGVPGRDLLGALATLVSGEGGRAGEFTLLLDWLSAWLVLAAGIVAWRRFGPAYGAYGLALLGFLLLPHSELKPLYSFSRYALMVFPLFWWWGLAGRSPWRHRLILYPSAGLLLYLSGQFFAWGWVA